MKKIAAVLILAMIVGTVPAWALSRTLDNFVAEHKKSEMAPVRDADRIVGGLNHGIHMMSDPVMERGGDKIAEPIRTVKDESIKGTKRLINETWNLLTKPFDRLRGEE